MTHLQAGLSTETTEKARVELNENPETLHQDIQQVLRSSKGPPPPGPAGSDVVSLCVSSDPGHDRDQARHRLPEDR